MRNLIGTILLTTVILVIAGCSGKGVETRTIEPEPMESVTMQLSTDGGSFVVNVDENNESTVHRFDSEGNLIESVDVIVTINNDGTFEIAVTFSDGTSITITGDVDENGQVSDIHLYIDGKEQDASVSVQTESENPDTSSQPKAASAKIVKVSVGEDETYALDEDGDVWTWDNNGDKPTKVQEDLGTVTDISSGNDFTCSLDTNGRAFCWINGNRENVTMLNSGTAVDIETSGNNVCITSNDDSAWCWNSLELNKPVAMFDRVIKTSIATEEICALVKVDRGSKKVLCKDLTNKTTKDFSGTNVIDIVSGDNHHCVLNTVRGIRCWGDNSEGQLGVSHSIIRTEPTDIDYIIAGDQLRASANHTCVLNENSGDIFCWGKEKYKSNGSELRKTTSETDFVDFDIGSRQNCAIDVKGNVWCWTGTTPPSKIKF